MVPNIATLNFSMEFGAQVKGSQFPCAKANTSLPIIDHHQYLTIK